MLTCKTASFIIVVLLIFNIDNLTAQTDTRKHIVTKGENVYRLSLRYGVSTEAIFQLNPGSRTMIKTGEELLIPKKNKSTLTTNSSNPKFKSHLVSKGETKYGLSKQFSISISELERINPKIKKMLLAGSIIQIPVNNLETKNTLYKQTPNSKIHIITKGETLWSISQKHGISLTELKALNKYIVNDQIQERDTLNINLNIKNQIEETYFVLKGDTKFGISQRFNLPIKKLEQLNPQIVPMLKYGTTLIIHEKITPEVVGFTTNENTTITQKAEKEFTPTKIASLDTVTKSSYRDYIIKPKETVYSLARKANMSMNDFLDLNPKLKESVLKGSVIKMPIYLINKENPVAEQTDYNQSLIKNKNTFNVSVIWDKSNTVMTTEELDKKSNYLIGLQKAIDTISTLYPLNKIEFNTEKITKAFSFVDSTKVYTHNVNLYLTDSLGQRLNSYKDDEDMLSLTYNYEDSIKEILIRSLPSKLDMRDKVLSYLKKQNGHIICIYDEDHLSNKLDIQSDLPNVTFISTNKNNRFNTNDLKKSLRSDLKNFVIVESDKVGVYLNTTNILLKEISNTNIQLVVLNAKNIPSENFISDKRFNILKLLYPKQFNTELNNGLNDHVALGFAVNFDTLQRLFKDGLQEFDTRITSVLGYAFNYELNNGVFDNKSVKLFIFETSTRGIEINEN